MFDSAFFGEAYPVLLDDFAARNGVGLEAVSQRVELRNGDSFEIDGGWWSDRWVCFSIPEEEAIRFVPIGDVAQIHVSKRDGVGRGNVGFQPAPAAPR